MVNIKRVNKYVHGQVAVATCGPPE